MRLLLADGALLVLRSCYGQEVGASREGAVFAPYVCTSQTHAFRTARGGFLPSIGDAPLFVFDAGYDPVRLQRRLGRSGARILIMLHSGRVFYADPPTAGRSRVDRPMRHGEKFDCKVPSAWSEPKHEHICQTADY